MKKLLIKLLEKYPVIAVDEARLLGHTKGVVLHDNRLTAILISLKSEDDVHQYNDINKNIQIPIEHLVIGPDAFVIKESSIAKIYFSFGQAIYSDMGVYTYEGELLGRITGVEIDTDYVIQGIHIESDYIEASRIIKIGDVIIADANTVKKELEDSVVFLEINQEENNEDIPNQTALEQENSQEYIEEIREKKSEVPLPSEEKADEEMRSNDEEEVIYSKYRYLLGKKLINSIIVADKSYPDNSIIDAELIKAALNNNCILNIIMNAED